MRTIVAGSRNITDYSILLDAIKKLSWKPTMIISGGCRGIDRFGEIWAVNNNISYDVFPPDWDRYGKKAGYLRNVEMSKHADALLAIWDGESKGTKHMIDIATKANLKVYIYKV